MGVQWWTLPVEIAMFGGVVTAITTFIMRANRNQRSIDTRHEEEQINTNRALTASLDRLSENIERLINDRQRTSESETQDNQS